MKTKFFIAGIFILFLLLSLFYLKVTVEEITEVKNDKIITELNALFIEKPDRPVYVFTDEAVYVLVPLRDGSFVIKKIQDRR